MLVSLLSIPSGTGLAALGVLVAAVWPTDLGVVAAGTGYTLAIEPVVDKPEPAGTIALVDKGPLTVWLVVAGRAWMVLQDKLAVHRLESLHSDTAVQALGMSAEAPAHSLDWQLQGPGHRIPLRTVPGHTEGQPFGTERHPNY
jgi:hypothetical protein